MFNLEESITEWRQRMLAAGIQAPVPLEELESHLRDEIEAQMKAGLNEGDAFQSATQSVGQADLLQPEFNKAIGVLGWFDNHKNVRINHAVACLGTLWFWDLVQWLGYDASTPHGWPRHYLIFWGGLLVFLAMVIRGVSLLRTVERGREMVQALVFLNVFGCGLCFFEDLWHLQYGKPTYLSFLLWQAVAIFTQIFSRPEQKIKPAAKCAGLKGENCV